MKHVLRADSSAAPSCPNSSPSRRFFIASVFGATLLSMFARAQESTATNAATNAANSAPTGSQISSQNSAKTAASADAPTTNPSATEAIVDAVVPSILTQIPAGSNFYSPYAFVVDKQARKLTVWQQTGNGMKSIAEFPADLGRNSGEKIKRNDRKTPEGIYFLQERREAGTIDPNIYGKRAFTTDYPNFFDRLEGKTGDGIWLHAVPDHVALTRGSSGCVVVRNEVILNISQYVKLGRTPILIQDHTDLLPTKEMEKQTAEVDHFVDAWRASWESKNIEDYIRNYADDFHSMHMNRSQWKRYKQRLTQNYKTIAVHLSKPAIFVDRNRAVIRFLQEYTSNRHSDLGEKVLYVKKIAGNYRILGETWAEESSDQARQEIEPAKSTKLSCANVDGEDCIQSRAASTH